MRIGGSINWETRMAFDEKLAERIPPAVGSAKRSS